LFNQVVQILLPVFLIVGIGFVVGKTLKTNFAPINRLNMDIFVPALIFTSLLSMKPSFSQLPLLSAALIGILLPGMVLFLVGIKGRQLKAWAPPQMFRNSGNLAIPLFGYAFGQSASESAVLLFVVSTIVHIIFVSLFLSNSPGVKIWRSFCSPIFLSAMLALGLGLFNVELYQPLFNGLTLMGQAAIPVMLISLGSQMCGIKKSGLKIGIICSLLSVATGAVAFAVIYWLIPLELQEMQMMVLFTMLPPAVMNYLFAERYQISPNKVASMVLFGNLSSIITLPLLLIFAFSLTA